MKDETKEILNWLKREANEITHYTDVDSEDLKILLDYITNLQEEKDKLKAELELYKDNHNYLNDKIDKATEYIEKDLEENPYENRIEHTYLLNILKGE